MVSAAGRYGVCRSQHSWMLCWEASLRRLFSLKDRQSLPAGKLDDGCSAGYWEEPSSSGSLLPCPTEATTVKLAKRRQHGVSAVALPTPARAAHSRLDDVARRTLDGAATNGIPAGPKVRIAHRGGAAGEVLWGLSHIIRIAPSVEAQGLQSRHHLLNATGPELCLGLLHPVGRLCALFAIDGMPHGPQMRHTMSPIHDELRVWEVGRGDPIDPQRGIVD
jgi:hypothetical protein